MVGIQTKKVWAKGVFSIQKLVCMFVIWNHCLFLGFPSNQHLRSRGITRNSKNNCSVFDQTVGEAQLEKRRVWGLLVDSASSWWSLEREPAESSRLPMEGGPSPGCPFLGLSGKTSLCYWISCTWTIGRSLKYLSSSEWMSQPLPSLITGRCALSLELELCTLLRYLALRFCAGTPVGPFAE